MKSGINEEQVDDEFDNFLNRKASEKGDTQKIAAAPTKNEQVKTQGK